MGQVVQSACPSSVLYVPAVQSLHLPEPASDLLPGGQTWHSVDRASEYSPPLHWSQPFLETMDVSPAKQSLQLCCPTSSWYLPAAHSTHAVAVTAPANLPASQSVQSVAPVSSENRPGVQSSQPRPTDSVPFLPRGQASQSSRSLFEYRPVLHVWQAPVGGLVLFLPAAHAVHSLEPEGLQWPGSHSSHSAAPSESPYLPASQARQPAPRLLHLPGSQ